MSAFAEQKRQLKKKKNRQNKTGFHVCAMKSESLEIVGNALGPV